MKYLQLLNLEARLPDEKEGEGLDCAMFHSPENICELQDTHDCITDNGLYFGTSDSREPKFCPRHYFTGTGYTLHTKKSTEHRPYLMEYDQLHYHIGHKIILNDIWDWHTNRESGLEIRCEEKECEGCEPLLEIDNPDWSPREE